MKSINTVFFIGRVTSEVTPKDASDIRKGAAFMVIINDSWHGKDGQTANRATAVHIRIQGNIVDRAIKIIKGAVVAIEGRLINTANNLLAVEASSIAEFGKTNNVKELDNEAN